MSNSGIQNTPIGEDIDHSGRVAGPFQLICRLGGIDKMRDIQDIESMARKQWDSGRVLTAYLGDNEGFPWHIRLNVTADIGQQNLKAWAARIESGCQCAVGHGYRIEYGEIDLPPMGRIRLPERVVFDLPMDVARFLEKTPDVAEYAALARVIRAHFSELSAWLRAHPMLVLRYRHEWPGLLQLLDQRLCGVERSDVDVTTALSILLDEITPKVVQGD